MLRINHAILHVCDFVSCVNVFSEAELDLSDKNAKKFCTGHAKKALGSIESKHGSFEQDSAFACELRAYFKGERDFADISAQVAEFLSGELGRAEKPESTDVLILDFEEDVTAPAPAEDACEEEARDAYDAKPKRYFGIMLLESRQAYMHEIGTTDAGLARADIKRHYAILPSPSQKVASYALIDAQTLSVLFQDKPRDIAGQERWIIPDGLLQCSQEASSKEVLDTVVRIVEEVAEEYGANAAVATSKAKASLAEASSESEYLAPWDLGAEVFEDEPLQRRFEEAVAAEALPERVAVEKKAVERVARNHKIRTDTGIEITFPSEYSSNPDFIEFVSEPNGLISIELKNIGHIENR